MNTELINLYDKKDYLKVLRDFDAQLSAAEKNVTDYYPELTRFRTGLKEIQQIVICGMGGSAIAGDFVKHIFSDKLTVPVMVNRDYELPAFVGESTLVILSSYSGNTEETISAFQSAIVKKAKTIAVSTGGEIAAMAKEQGIPHLSVPSGYQPRQAIGFSLVTLFRILEHLFFETHDPEIINKAIEWVADKKKVWLSEKNNELWNLANRLCKKPVIVYASDKCFPAALRFKGQVCENAKLLAFAYAVPEMNHNEIVGWDSVSKDEGFPVVIFRDETDHPQIQKRFEILNSILSSKTDVIEFHGEGADLFIKLLSMIYWGDIVSYFIAIHRKTDPTPVDIITHFKNELSK
jgi:glucose/mannose-6-phosphate isomerase